MDSFPVSIIVPCYNQADFLRGTLNSVAGQSFPALEVIVVNDGSSDDTSAVVRHAAAIHPQPIILVEQENLGQARARHRGLEQARGQWLILLDADDRLAPDMIAKAANAANDNPQADLIVGNARFIGQDVDTALGELHQARRVGWPDVLEGNPYGALAAVMIKAESVRQIGGLAVAGRSGCEDWDLWVRMARCGMNICPVETLFGDYRLSSDSYSRRALAMLEAGLDVLNLAHRKDPRLEACRPAPPIDEACYQRVRNMYVFAIFGEALAGEADETVLTSILEQLVPGTLDARRCGDRLLDGLQLGLRARGASVFPAPDQYENHAALLSHYLALRGHDRSIDRLVKHLQLVIDNPFRPRSLMTRLRHSGTARLRRVMGR